MAFLVVAAITITMVYFGYSWASNELVQRRLTLEVIDAERIALNQDRSALQTERREFDKMIKEKHDANTNEASKLANQRAELERMQAAVKREDEDLKGRLAVVNQDKQAAELAQSALNEATNKLEEEKAQFEEERNAFEAEKLSLNADKAAFEAAKAVAAAKQAINPPAAAAAAVNPPAAAAAAVNPPAAAAAAVNPPAAAAAAAAANLPAAAAAAPGPAEVNEPSKLVESK
jgi:hypothetical protein